MSTTPESARKVSAKPRNANGSGTVHKITYPSGAKAWRGSVYDVTVKRRHKNFRLKGQAQDEVDQQRQARHAGEITYASIAKVTTAEFLLNWVESQKAYVKFNTYQFYRASIRSRINPFIGHNLASKISPQAHDQVQSFHLGPQFRSTSH